MQVSMVLLQTLVRNPLKCASVLCALQILLACPAACAVLCRPCSSTFLPTCGWMGVTDCMGSRDE